MCINRNKEKRSKMKDVFAFIKNMGSFSVKPGPVISKENLEILRKEDEEDLMEGMISDTQKQKEFVREMEKKHSSQNNSIPKVIETKVDSPIDSKPSTPDLSARPRTPDSSDPSPRATPSEKKERRKSTIGMFISGIFGGGSKK